MIEFAIYRVENLWFWDRWIFDFKCWIGRTNRCWKGAWVFKVHHHTKNRGPFSVLRSTIWRCRLWRCGWKWSCMSSWWKYGWLSRGRGATWTWRCTYIWRNEGCFRAKDRTWKWNCSASRFAPNKLNSHLSLSPSCITRRKNSSLSPLSPRSFCNLCTPCIGCPSYTALDINYPSRLSQMAMCCDSCGMLCACPSLNSMALCFFLSPHASTIAPLSAHSLKTLSILCSDPSKMSLEM